MFNTIIPQEYKNALDDNDTKALIIIIVKRVEKTKRRTNQQRAEEGWRLISE
jgi:enterochelin esterase-like enzyme